MVGIISAWKNTDGESAILLKYPNRTRIYYYDADGEDGDIEDWMCPGHHERAINSLQEEGYHKTGQAAFRE